MDETRTILAKRSTEVLFEINNLKDKMVESYFELGELLLEARNGNYNKDWGYPQFKDWVEEASGLDMGWRQAYYLMSIMERSKQLGYTHEDLKKIKISKLKEIFTVEDDATVRKLMETGEDMSLEEVRDAVKPQRNFTFMNLKVTKDGKKVILEAIERARQMYGNTRDAMGNPIDISEGKAIELICADFLGGVQVAMEHERAQLLVEADKFLAEAEGGLIPVEGEQDEH